MSLRMHCIVSEHSLIFLYIFGVIGFIFIMIIVKLPPSSHHQRHLVLLYTLLYCIFFIFLLYDFCPENCWQLRWQLLSAQWRVAPKRIWGIAAFLPLCAIPIILLAFAHFGTLQHRAMQMLTQCTMHLLKNREQSGQDFLCHFLIGTEETKSQQNHRFVWLWLGQNPNFYRKFLLNAPLSKNIYTGSNSISCDMTAQHAGQHFW